VDDRRLANIERSIAFALWTTAALGLYSTEKPLAGEHSAAAFYFSMLFWLPYEFMLGLAAARVSRWRHRRPGRNLRFLIYVGTAQYRPGRRLIRMEADLSKPIRRETVLSGARQVSAPAPVFAAVSAALLVAAWLTSRQPLALAFTCDFAIILAWEIYPRRQGIRYSTGWLEPDSLVRALCRGALKRGFEDARPIQEWHPDFFALIQTPSDGSTADLAAASWNYTYALLRGDLEAAARFLQRRLALLPKDSPDTAYFTLGDALYFFTLIVPEQERSTALLSQIRAIRWEMPSPAEAYIEAAIALAEGRRADALRLAQGQLDRIGSERGSARIQLHREVLTRCLDAAR
jgi:hypothetical protein